MINPSFEELRKVDTSRYALSMVISKRAKRIHQGSEILIDTKEKKPVTIACEEMMEGKIDFKYGKDR